MVAAAIVGGAVIGGVASNMAAGKASDAQVQAGQESNATQLAMYNQTRADQEPWRKAGMGALDQMSAGTAPGGDFNRDFTLADFQKDPGYQFRMDQGSDALQASAAARGALLNGGTLKALSRYGQDYASGEYSNAYNRFNNDRTQRFNRLSSLAGTGQTAATNVGNMGTQTAYGIGQTQQAMGNARASGYVGQANAINNGISSLSNFYMQRQYMNPQTTTTPTASGGGSMPWAGGDSGSGGIYYG
jgi:hypothetical protein